MGIQNARSLAPTKYQRRADDAFAAHTEVIDMPVAASRLKLAAAATVFHAAFFNAGLICHFRGSRY